MRSPLCSRSFLFFVASCSCCSMAAFRLLSTLSDLSTEALKSFGRRYSFFPKFREGTQSGLNWSKSFAGCPWWKWRPQTLSVSRIFFSAVSPRRTALIHLSLRFLVSSSYSSPWSVIILGIRKNPRLLCLPLLDPHPHTMHKTIVNSPTFPHTSFFLRSLCLLSRDTNMAASNRCQAKGHVGEKQELVYVIKWWRVKLGNNFTCVLSKFW